MPPIYKVKKTHEIKKDKQSMQDFISKECAMLVPLEQIELTFEWVQDELFGWEIAIDVKDDVIIVHELECIFA